MEKVEVKLSGVVFSFGNVTQEVHDRLLDKRVSGHAVVGEREFVMSCLLPECDLDKLKEALKKKPGAVKVIAQALLDAYGGPEPVATEDAVSLEGVTFHGPDLDQWEEMREKLGADGTKFGEEARSFLLALADKQGEASALFERYPVCIESLYAKVGEIAGAGIQVTVKKG